MKNYYYLHNNQQLGPFTIEELKTKGIKQETLVWHEGMGDWQKAGTVAELSSIFAPPPSPSKPIPLAPPPTPPPPTPQPPPPLQQQPQTQQVPLSAAPIRQAPKKKGGAGKVILIIVAVIIIAVIAWVFIKPGSKSNFQTFSSTNGAFTVEMPGQVQQSTENIPSQLGNLQMIQYIVDLQNTVYYISHLDYHSEAVRQADPSKLINNALEGAVSSMGCNITYNEEINLKGETGLQFRARGQNNGQDIIVEGMYFLVGNRMYQIYVYGLESSTRQSDIDKFLESFQFDF